MSQKAEKITPQDELSELLGFAPEPEPEPESQPGIVEESPPIHEPDVEPEADPEPVKGEPEPEGDTSPKPEPVAAQETDAQRREKALRAEIAKLRQAARDREQRESMRFAPPPVQAVPVEAAAKKPAGVPVRVSDDGSSVYVDPAELDRLVEERAARAVEERMKPTPEQVKQALAQRTIGAFMAENPAHAEVASRTGEALQFVNLSLRNAIQQAGVVPYSSDDLISIARESGLSQQFGEFFPDLAPHLEELIEADATENVAWKARIMRRIAASTDSEGMAPPVDIRRPAGPQLRSVANAPRSLASKGGQRSASLSPDQQEFETLEREFRRDIVFFPPENRRRLEELGKKLGKTGYV